MYHIYREMPRPIGEMNLLRMVKFTKMVHKKKKSKKKEIQDKLKRMHKMNSVSVIIGIKHGFPCINVCQVPREMLKTEAVGRGFQHLPRDLANVNILEINV